VKTGELGVIGASGNFFLPWRHFLWAFLGALLIVALITWWSDLCVHPLDILEAMTEGRGGHNIISSGSEHCLDGSIRVVSLLMPGLLVPESSPGVEVLKHVLHAIGC